MPTGLGQMLARARQARGLTLEDAERDTRIARNYLRALEEERFERLPAPVYARGFLRSYSQYLGLDAAEVLALFPQQPEINPAAVLRQAPALPKETQRGPSGLNFGAVLVVFIIFAVAGLYLAASLLFNRSSNSTPPQLLLRAGPASATAPAGGTVVVAPTTTPTPPPRAVGKMPDLVGKESTEALATLQALQINPLILQVYSSQQPAGRVVRSEPTAGASLQTSTPVLLVLSRGAQP